MNLTARSKHGLRIMVELALNSGQGLMQIKTIAERVGISSKYIEQLLTALKVGGLFQSRKGPMGGLALARQPSEIKVSEVINALGEPTYDIKCTKHSKFTKGCNDCIARHMWSKINGTIWDLLESTTLQDLIDMKK